MEFLLKNKRTERQTRSYYYHFIMCAVHDIFFVTWGGG